MKKDLIRKLKTGFITLGLAGGLSCGAIKTQKTTDYQTNDKNIYEFYKQKQDSLHENYDGIEKDIQRRYEQKRDSIFNVYQDYYKKKKGIEDKKNDLIFALPDTLSKSFRKKADSLDRVFNPEKENPYNNYKQKKDSISNLYKQKVYKDYHGPKEESILENILEEFFGKYLIEVLVIEQFQRDGSWIPDSIVYKTPWDFLDPFDYRRIHGSKMIGAWQNRELAKWLQSLGESKRDSFKKSFLEKEEKITWGDLWELRSKLNKNYQESLYKQKEDIILENILIDFFGEYTIDTVYLGESDLDGNMTLNPKVYETPWNFFKCDEQGFIKNYEDSVNYETDYGNFPKTHEDSVNYETDYKIKLWENRELAKWLMSLGESKRDSLKKSILEKEREITRGYLWNLRRELDKNYPKKPVRIPRTEIYYIPQKLKGQTISKNALLIYDKIYFTTQYSNKKNIKFKKKRRYQHYME